MVGVVFGGVIRVLLHRSGLGGCLCVQFRGVSAYRLVFVVTYHTD